MVKNERKMEHLRIQARKEQIRIQPLLASRCTKLVETQKDLQLQLQLVKQCKCHFTLQLLANLCQFFTENYLGTLLA